MHLLFFRDKPVRRMSYLQEHSRHVQDSVSRTFHVMYDICKNDQTIDRYKPERK